MKIVRLFVTILEISFYKWITTVADTNYREVTFINGTVVLNCKTQRQKIHVESVEYNASICSGTNGSILQHLTTLCNGNSFCEFVVLDTINDLNLTCPRNETAEYLLDIDYYCTLKCVSLNISINQLCGLKILIVEDGSRWSAWSEYSSCSLTCGGGVQSRSRLCNDPVPNRYGQNCTDNDVEQQMCNTLNCSNPIVKIYTEGERAHLTCSKEYKETIDIISINYIHGPCSHSGTYGIRNLCNGKTNCSFSVSNSNIGSSCGANGRATLDVKYNCIRNGGWSNWNPSDSCPVSCGGGVWNVTRTCSKPFPNEIGRTCSGDEFDEQTCNTNNCIDQNTACLGTTVIWNCLDGIIKVEKAVWETSRKCGYEYISFKSLIVIRAMKSICGNRRNCTFVANDHHFGVSCSGSNSRCTIFDYVYTCIRATWDVWSLWSECTTSCGGGIQTRQRQCLNQMNTTDGYVTECEGIGTGSRSCNTEPCPCYSSKISNKVNKRRTRNGNKITTGSYDSKNPYGSISSNSEKERYEKKYQETTYLRKSTQFNVSEDKRIVITKGDIIGWFDSGSNIVGFHDCLPNNDKCLSFRLSNAIRKGDVVEITSLSRTPGRSYTVNYSTVENRPIAFDLPSEPVNIPDHLNVDTFVMTIPIYDPDYGDYIQDFNLDYDNEYFILIPNCPPVISGLQKKLELDPATADTEPYLTKFQVMDPSGDNVSCMINETKLFYLQINDIGMTKNNNNVYLKLVNNVSIQSNTSSEFILTITCEDGTENTEFELKIQFRPKNEGTPTIDENEPTNIPMIVGMSIGSLFVIIILIILACIWKKRRKLVVNETSEDKLKHATCSIAAGVTENPYHDMGQTTEQHNTNDYVEMSGKPPAKEKAFHLGTTEVGAYTEAWR
ncbi:unnamed protein product [Mytilus edulis]|uniref:Uncharacterized protein n=1 Tax=Mytilus edulis TaxID=6550 RepID=A0A8S3TK65_MYTED|nr:unnamed protein product [Mytilus edulis]